MAHIIMPGVRVPNHFLLAHIMPTILDTMGFSKDGDKRLMEL